MNKSRIQYNRIEFGDFQTPIHLAREVCSVVTRTGFKPASILEPTCGEGTFIQAALEIFTRVKQIRGFDINPTYVNRARNRASKVSSNAVTDINKADFFNTDWKKIIESMPQPVMILGNPPWVTNSELGAMRSNNIPYKSNFDKMRGIEALTGKSNFDISEYMLRKNIEWLKDTEAVLAVLCKTAVARKVIEFTWKNEISTKYAAIHRIDSMRFFSVSVDACLLIVYTHPTVHEKVCEYHETLRSQSPGKNLGFIDKRLVSDVLLYQKRRYLIGNGLKGWRSGIKHDCSKVFELQYKNGRYINGFGDDVDLEDDFIFPLMKSSDLATQRKPNRFLLVHQKTLNEDPKWLQDFAPKTWRYLNSHSQVLDKRASSIYKKRPRFSIFGVGDYCFAPWKIAIAGLYKKVKFVKVPKINNRPVVFDDTCYLFPCWSEYECNILYEIVTSQPAYEYLSSLIFWDSKRPITASLLNSLDLAAVARTLGLDNDQIQLMFDANNIHKNQVPLFRNEV